MFRGDTPCMSGSVGWFADRTVTEADGVGQTGTGIQLMPLEFAPDCLSAT
jgi:hypothetical protein